MAFDDIHPLTIVLMTEEYHITHQKRAFYWYANKLLSFKSIFYKIVTEHGLDKLVTSNIR